MENIKEWFIDYVFCGPVGLIFLIFFFLVSFVFSAMYMDNYFQCKRYQLMIEAAKSGKIALNINIGNAAKE